MFCNYVLWKTNKDMHAVPRYIRRTNIATGQSMQSKCRSCLSTSKYVIVGKTVLLGP
jgi:hypothetical protein